MDTESTPQRTLMTISLIQLAISLLVLAVDFFPLPEGP